MILKGKGTSPADCAPLLTVPTNHAYQATVELEIKGNAEGGLLLYYEPSVFAGIGYSKNGLVKYERARAASHPHEDPEGRIFLKVVNYKHQVSFFHSKNGENRIKYPSGIEVSSYHHNAFGQFLSLRVGLYAAGDGEVVYRNFTYQGLD